MNIIRKFNTIDGWNKELNRLFQDNIELMENNDYPDLYDSGIVYERENIGVENWQSAEDLLNTMAGDCEDLACYRAAQYSVNGIDARPQIVRIKENQYHAVVRMPDGTIEDPSKILIAKHGYHGRGMPRSGGKRGAKWKVHKRVEGPCVAFVGLPALRKSRPDTAADVGYIWIPGRGKTAVSALGNAVDNTYSTQQLPVIPTTDSGIVYADGQLPAVAINQLPPDLLNTALQNPELQALALTNPAMAVAMQLLSNPAVQQGLKRGGKALKRKLRKWF